MRAVVLSDSHGDVRACINAIERMGKVDLIIHLGDIFSDVKALWKAFPDIPLEYVLGNNDFYAIGDFENVIEFDSHKIFITHGHKYSILDREEEICKAALKQGCSLALFGHTHRACDKTFSDVRIINPGSVSRPRGGSRSFAVLESENQVLKAAIVDWI